MVQRVWPRSHARRDASLCRLKNPQGHYRRLIRGRRRVLDFRVNDVSGPPLATWFHALSSAPEAFPMKRGWAQGTGQRIGLRRAERAFGARD
jgi:hypothetical protein